MNETRIGLSSVEYTEVCVPKTSTQFYRFVAQEKYTSLNVFDDGAVLLRSIIWTLSIVSMFCNHNVSRDGSSLVIRWT
jgi:hypothetical protein